MYSTVGFLEPQIEIKNLKRDDKEEDTINIRDCDSEEEILKSDILCYATRNTEELSYIEFHIIDKITNENEELEDIDFLMHHDIFVTDTIASSAYFKINNQHYIAYTGFQENIEVFDALTYNPLLPNFTFKGHTDCVNQIISSDKNLFSVAKDKKCIFWDLETQKIKNIIEHNDELNKIAIFEDHKIVMCDSNSIIYNDMKLVVENEIECLKVKQNYIYTGDSKGNLTSYDIRQFNKPLFVSKVHTEEITSFDFIGAGFVTVGVDKMMIHLDENFNILFKKNSDKELFSVSYDPNSKIAIYGGMSTNLLYHHFK